MGDADFAFLGLTGEFLLGVTLADLTFGELAPPLFAETRWLAGSVEPDRLFLGVICFGDFDLERFLATVEPRGDER